MSQQQRMWVLSAMVAQALAIQCASAAEAKPPPRVEKKAAPDVHFLEYLGTLESDEDNWTDVSAEVGVGAQVDLPAAQSESAAAKPEADARSAETKR